MINEKLRGMIVIAVYRCSTDDQVENSLERQREICRSYAAENGIIIIDEVEIPGKSATQGQQMAYLRGIVDRKKAGLNFKGILFADYSRIARIMDDAERFYLDCRDAELVIVTHKEGLMEGKTAWMQRGVVAQASEAFGASHSGQTNSGIMRAIAMGRIPCNSATPYGMDRRFVGASGQHLFIVRRLPGKRIQKLSPIPPHEIIEEFSGRGRRRCVLRQGNDRIEFVAGDFKAVQVVRRIYQMFFHPSAPVGCHKIARTLNDEGIPAPNGGLWHTSSVKIILQNSSYTGLGVICKLTSGVHTVRRVGNPIVYETPRRPGFTTAQPDKPARPRASVPQLRRPVNEWFPVRQPLLMNFLDDPHLRRRAKAWRRKWRHGLSQSPKPTNARRRNPDSPHLLSGLIHMMPGGIPMVGSPTSRNKNGEVTTWRYYYLSRAANRPKTDDPQSVRLPAQLIEQTFLQLLEEVFSSPDAVGDQVAQFIADGYAKMIAARSDLSTLISEKEQKQTHLAMILRLGPTAQKLAFEEAQRLENRINELDRLIGSAQKSIPVRPTDTPEIVASVTRQLTELRKTIKDSPLKTLRKVAETFVGRIEFHCESRRVDMEIRLPAWALTRKDDILRRVRTEDSSGNTTAHQPNCENSVILAKTSCAVHSGTGRRKPCVSCSRLAA